jgi:uncharacterized protein
MDICMLDGYLTAIAIGPETVFPSQWLPGIWGDAGQPNFDSREHVEQILKLIVRYFNQIVITFMDAPEQFRPFLCEFEDKNGEVMISAEEWCVGFSLGVELQSKAWEPLFEDKVASELLTPIIAFSLEEATKELREGPDAAETEAAMIAMLPIAVQGIHAYWLPVREKRAPGLVKENIPLGGSTKAARNASCPCGSGKKFKKCCGAPGREA